jgi:hypothetical protein
VQAGTRFWTAVWPTKDNFPNVYTETPYARNGLHWLVSGNDGTNSLTPATTELALGSDGTPSDPTTTAILAKGGGSGAAATDRAVAAKVVKITPKNTDTSPGGYAWWAGDEGVKARVNSRAGYATGATAKQSDYSAPRRGWETVDGFKSYPAPSKDSILSGLVSPAQIALLDASLKSSSSARGEAFHDATTDSLGVLTDTLQGGLRVDLTTLLRQDMANVSGSRFVNYPKSNTNIIPAVAAPTLKGPKWDTLKAFRDLGVQLTSDGKLKVVQGDGIKTLNIAPLISDVRLLLGARLVAKSTNNFTINPCGKLAIGLANPYPYTMTWDKDLEVEVTSDETPAGNRTSCIFDAAGQPAFLPTPPSRVGQASSEPAVFNNALFIIPKGSLAPGQARAYTVGSSIIRPAMSISTVKVEMKEFSQADAGNFNNCVELVNTTVNTTTTSSDLNLDVREGWTTSLATVTMRVSGAAKTDYLRRVARFELDNGFYATTRRPVSYGISSKITKPFPLKCYSFQLSQPGADYQDVLPSASLMGTRSSTQRTYTDFNLQARTFMKPIASYNPPPFFMEASDSLSSLPFTAPGGQTGAAFTRNLSVSPLPWGQSPFGPQSTILFSPPRDLVSLAQLQHADLTADDQNVSVGHQPGNAVGNSYATPFVKRKFGLLARTDFTIIGSPNPSGVTPTKHTYFDLSYLLNTALWDSYFFSTIPESGKGVPTNPSMVISNPTTTNLNDPAKAAEDLLVEGSFNVNSPRKDAWKALLAGARQLHHPAQKAGGTDAVSFPRSLEQPDAGTSPPTGNDKDSFSGFRTLTDDQIDLLATEITRQVRLRGPFLSLSQFVNRALIPIATSPELSRSGALQSAIDNAGLNISIDGTRNVFSHIDPKVDRVRFQANGKGPRADLDGTAVTQFPNPAPMVWAPASKDLNPGAVAGILADNEMLTSTQLKPEQGFRSTGIPGWLTQADVLQVIGPSLSARSDTFRVRAYGECTDPATGKATARAWCEAIVQRTTHFVDSKNEPSASTTTLTPVNLKFGRHFEIVSFHWLLPDEI